MEQKKTPIVQLNNVTKRIKGKTLVDKITIDLYPGEVFGFLGPNGAGKTTTIRMMVGLMSISEGTVNINGYDITTNFEKAIQHVGGIVENPEMYKFLTGFQNLVHFARMTKGITEERIQEVISLVGLENRIHEKVKTYSLGMRQRLGVAQALLHKPKLLILDEPTNGLDPAGIRELRDYLRKLAVEENIAVFVSSHLLSEMELMCDRVGIIQNGKVIDVRLMKELVGHGESRSEIFCFEVDRNKQAGEIINALGYSYQQAHSSIEVEIARENIPLLNNEFVKNGVSVFGIYMKNRTLEDTFLEMTRGEQIV